MTLPPSSTIPSELPVKGTVCRRHSIRLAPALLLCCWLLAALGSAWARDRKPLTFEDLLRDPAESGSAPQFVEWSPDGRRLSFLRPAGRGQELYAIDAAGGRGAVLIPSDKLAPMMSPQFSLAAHQRENRARYNVAAYQWTPDSNGLLFSASGQLWFHDLRDGVSRRLTTSAEADGDPKFSPDGRHLSFVRAHNLFVRPAPSRGAQPTPGNEWQLTAAGPASEVVLNGDCDWLYREELDVRSNYFWSPDSQRIVYLQMDESQVPEYPLVDWTPTRVARQRYPRPGEPNPRVRLGVVDLAGHNRWLEVAGTGAAPSGDLYIPRFGWLNPRVVWALVLDRRQRQQQLYFIDVASGESRLALGERDSAYLELHDGLRFLASPGPSGAGRFLWPSWRDGHTHLYLYEFDSAAPLSAPARLARQLTRGDWEVLSVTAIEEAAGAVYFIANREDPRQAQLYRVALEGGEPLRMTNDAGVHEPHVAAGARYFVDSYSSLTVSPRLRLCPMPEAHANGAGQCAEIWRSKGIEQYDLLTPQFVEFKAADGALLYGALLMPPAPAGRKLPLLLNPYGGPHEQTVRDQWSTMTLFDQVIARRGFAILKVDNRGTGNRGREFAMARTGGFGGFGPLEFADQLAALDQTLARFPQLDGGRLGWWGWSFGGTLAAYALMHSDRFAAGAAVAPVTDWREYDSTFSERYLGFPQENPAGYRSGSILEAAAGLRGHLLIAHGADDDNVHLSNSMQLVSRLVAAGKQFDLEVYPGNSHGISAARQHLYRRMLTHFERWLLPDAASHGSSEFADKDVR